MRRQNSNSCKFSIAPLDVRAGFAGRSWRLRSLSCKTCPNANGFFWEYHLLYQALERGTIDVGQAKAIVQASIQEVLVALIDRPISTTNWKLKTMPYS